MDKNENPRKCTIHPLKERSDFHIRYFRGNKPIAKFEADCLLHMDGIDLSTLAGRKFSSIALIDCTWKKVGGALQRIEGSLPTLVRIPEGFTTAYPRKNKEGNDPDGGLATIEALFIAAAFLGTWDETLLDKFYFKDKFLDDNQATFRKYELGPHA